jgi:PAS domain S-box-containing protein
MNFNSFFKPSQLRRGCIPYFVLALSLLLTAGATSYVAISAQAKDKLRFQNVVNRTQNSIESRLDTYIALLRAGSGLFAASNQPVSREQFRTFVNSLLLNDYYPGTRGIGFSMRVRADEKEALIASMNQQGWEDFDIKPDSLEREYHSIIYIEPLDRRNKAVIGYNMFTDVVRRAAMERARDNGTPVATPKVTLVQEIDQHKQAGFLIYSPVYRNRTIPTTIAERREMLLGFVYSPFRADDFMQGIFGTEPQPFLNFEIYDGRNISKENLLHSTYSRATVNNSLYVPQFRTTKIIDVAGQPWSIVFTSSQKFDTISEARFVPYIALVGIAISSVLFGVTRSQINALGAAERAAKELGESEERFRKLTEKVRVIPWEVDAITCQFTYVGPQATDILGYPVSDWYSENFWGEHLHPEDKDWVVKSCQENSAELDNYELEYRMLAADGREVWLYDIVNVVRGEHGPKLLRGFMIDITERKQAEQEREQLLEHTQEAHAEAEAANRMKDEFLATLSHELRTPLNGMMGWTKLLLTRQFDEATTTRALETIDRNTKALLQLIEDILDVSRIITGKLRLNLSKVEIAPVIEAAIETVQPAVQAKSINLTFSILPSQIPQLKFEVLGDATRLQQIVWNLLSNAVKFTNQGGKVEVRLSTLSTHDTPFAVIEVQDYGAGIAPEFLPYVFDRFRQADSSKTRVHGGLGLGLAIVRHLVELHGGTVSASSPGLGYGAIFTVKFPLVNHSPSTAPSPELNSTQSKLSTHRSLSSENPPLLDRLRILVVDDEPDARDLITMILQEHGAQVITAASAVEALTALQQQNPHVLVSDIGMPLEDGYSLIRKIRALHPSVGGEIPAVALTAYVRLEDRRQALLAGFQNHIAKPVNPTEIVTVVAHLAGRR